MPQTLGKNEFIVLTQPSGVKNPAKKSNIRQLPNPALLAVVLDVADWSFEYFHARRRGARSS